MYALCVSGAVNTQGFVWKLFVLHICIFIHSFKPLKHQLPSRMQHSSRGSAYQLNSDMEYTILNMCVCVCVCVCVIFWHACAHRRPWFIVSSSWLWNSLHIISLVSSFLQGSSGSEYVQIGNSSTYVGRRSKAKEERLQVCNHQLCPGAGRKH